ncbi:MAG TPA: hypothetical protein V6D08_17515 [Candidatus Obscuribacterales bacterium]
MEVTNLGQVNRIQIPDGWIEGPSNPYQGIGNRTLVEFHPPEAPEARLCFFYRGLPLDAQSGAKFVEIVAANPAHTLSADEVQCLKGVLNERADPAAFALSLAQTTDLNGRRVLMVGGQYRESQRELMEILIDVFGTGTVIEEIFFQAPTELYFIYFTQVQPALTSIEWKSSVESLVNVEPNSDTPDAAAAT